MHIFNKHDENFKIKYIFNYQMPYPNIKKMDDLINSKSKPLHSINIWIKNINNEVNDLHLTISITNTINFEHCDLQSDFGINHVMDQTKNHNLKKLKISQNHHIP